MADQQAVPSVAVGSSLDGRVALITGGTRGIGAAISQSLASQGATIAAGYSSDTDRATSFAASFADAYGTAVSVHRGNIAKPEDCRRVVGEVVEQHGRLDILVNNAGITIDRTVLKMTDEDWYKVIAVNLSGTFFMSQAALRHMLERGSGRVINVSSIIGEVGNIGQSNYAASKSGLFGLTKSLAREAAFMLGRSGTLDVAPGLTINTVSPGFTVTDMVAAMPERAVERVISDIPLRRMAEPEEIARVVSFLAADASAYITGQVWAVNGGMDM